MKQHKDLPKMHAKTSKTFFTIIYLPFMVKLVNSAKKSDPN